MKHLLTVMLINTFLSSSSVAYGFQSSNPAAGSGTEPSSGSVESSAYALKLLETMNKGGGYSRDLYRNTFMQIMGLVFFDPNTPDIGACQKDVLNYHLPELTRSTMDFKLLKEDLSRTMSEVYTADELKWLQQFYSSPFGERMLKKQLIMNERITRDLAKRYGNLRPEFQKMYGIVNQRCGGKKSSIPIDAPKIGSELLNDPNISASPVAPSPQPVSTGVRP